LRQTGYGDVSAIDFGLAGVMATFVATWLTYIRE
jgi:hypothetical protein